MQQTITKVWRPVPITNAAFFSISAHRGIFYPNKHNTITLLCAELFAHYKSLKVKGRLPTE